MTEIGACIVLFAVAAIMATVLAALVLAGRADDRERRLLGMDPDDEPAEPDDSGSEMGPQKVLLQGYIGDALGMKRVAVEGNVGPTVLEDGPYLHGPHTTETIEQHLSILQESGGNHTYERIRDAIAAGEITIEPIPGGIRITPHLQPVKPGEEMRAK